MPWSLSSYSIIPDSIQVPSVATIHGASQSKDLTPWSELEQGDPGTSPLCCSKTGYNSRSESISITVRLKAKRRALNCCQNVDRGTSKKKRLLTNYKPEWRAVRPSIGSKGKLRQQFNLHFSHIGSFFYRRTSMVDGGGVTIRCTAAVSPAVGREAWLKETVYMTVIPKVNTFIRDSKQSALMWNSYKGTFKYISG